MSEKFPELSEELTGFITRQKMFFVGSAEVCHRTDSRYSEFSRLIPPATGTRQYFLVNVDLVQTSCGYAVPFMDHVEDRTALSKWAEKRGDAGIREYWQEKNQLSLDGRPTGALES